MTINANKPNPKHSRKQWHQFLLNDPVMVVFICLDVSEHPSILISDFLPSTGPYHLVGGRGGINLIKRFNCSDIYYGTQMHIYNQINININVYNIPLRSKRMEKNRYIYKNPPCLQLLRFSKFSLHGPDQHIEFSKANYRCCDHSC